MNAGKTAGQAFERARAGSTQDARKHNAGTCPALVVRQ